ncbi:hypothetical protein JKP88DRAFT_251818 [Tribonema minus]|uniref:PARP catalytic domain-containing protein n=1 Tax=Tribonema minus TaxID=303371 RepID=A0A835ZB56_9STRA|nr:hypothetical protein JKP88DRAFT_251818 [Tribonema minus]
MVSARRKRGDTIAKQSATATLQVVEISDSEDDVLPLQGRAAGMLATAAQAATAMAAAAAMDGTDTDDDVLIVKDTTAAAPQRLASARPQRHAPWITAIKRPPGGAFALLALAPAHPERPALEQLVTDSGIAVAAVGAHSANWAQPGVVAQYVQAMAAQQAQAQQVWGRPVIVSAYKIRAPAHVVARFEAYAATKPRTVKRCFHGTKSACNLVRMEEVAELGPCGQSNCAACNICTGGLSIDFAKHGTYGKGTYFTENVSKSQAYGAMCRWRPSLRTQAGAQHFMLLVCDVVAGRTYVNKAAQAPPMGYDTVGHTVVKAVTGKHTARGAGGGGRAPPEVKRLSRLMDELVVYRDDASVPRYLLLCRPARLF